MSWRFSDELSAADVGFEAEGSSLLELLRSAVDATLAVMVGDPARLRPRRTVPVRLEAKDSAGLLFDLLQEVIFRKDADRLLLRLADGTIEERGGGLALAGVLRGETLDRGRHEPGTDVKAVTLYRFAVVERDGRWYATVVLDV
jgi:SHS2 domain-containing protein